MKTLLLCFSLATSVGAATYQQMPFHGCLDPPSCNVWWDTQSVESDPNRVLVADDFVLSDDTAVATVRWWGNWYNGASREFQIRMYSDAGGSPGSLLSSLTIQNLQEVFTGRDVSTTYSEFEYTASLQTPFLAQGGVRYWLSIGNPTSPEGNWAWEFSLDTQNRGVARSFSGGPWQSDSFINNMAFVVPEPSPLLLLVAALTAMIPVHSLTRKR